MDTLITHAIAVAVGVVIGFFVYRNNRDELSPALDKIDKAYDKLEEKVEQKFEEVRSEIKNKD